MILYPLHALYENYLLKFKSLFERDYVADYFDDICFEAQPMMVIEALRTQRRASFVARTRFDKSRLSLFLSLAKQRKKREEGQLK